MKKARLSSGLGVRSSTCARWARSNERSVDCKALLSLEVILLAVPWIPLGAVRLLLEIGADDERHREIRRILHDRRDREPLVLAGGEPFEVLGEHGVLAVGHAVAAQPAAAHVGGRHLERSPRRGGARRAASAVGARA